MVSSRSSAMPERSNIKPMSVKKGMASKVSFCMMPNMRKGRACNKASGNTPSSMPMKPKNSPQAPKLKATGKPSIRKTISPRNMTGARFCIKNSMVVVPDSGVLWMGFGFCQLANFFGQFFFGRFFAGLEGWVRNQAFEKSDAFDQFRRPL